MAADTNTFVAGHYTATYGGADIGTTEVGFTIAPVFNREEIRIDDYGDAIVDGIWRGYNLRVRSQLSEWAAAARENLQFRFDKEDGGTLGQMQLIGQTLSKFAEPLVLTPVSGINSNNLTYTFPLAIPEPNHGSFNINTKLRKVDIDLLILPNRSTGVLFTQS